MIAEAAAAFRALHHAEAPLLLPNAWDYASAAAMVAAEFGSIGTTSLGVAAAHGLPDGRGRIRDETLALARRLGGLPCLLTVDIEGGFSQDPDEVADIAAELATAGTVGVNLEDGRSDGTLADPGRLQELISAVKARVPELFVNARIDTYWLDVDDRAAPAATLARADRYLAAGADGIFVPGVTDDGHIAAMVEGVQAPLNVLYLPGKQTLRQLADLGVRRISTGSLLFRSAVHAAIQTALAIRDGVPVDAGVPGYAEIQRMVTGAG